MTQDIGPEDEVVQGAEVPVDQQEPRRKRSSVWPWVALAIVLLLIIWLLWQYLDGVSNGPDAVKVTVSRVAPVTPGGGAITELEGDVATGSDEAEAGVPDVVGMTRSAAVSAIQAAGYRASVTDVYGTSKPANTVFQQNPTGGARLEQGGTVGLLVQQRPGSQPTVTVPQLTGLSQSAAERKLRALGLEIVLQLRSRRVPSRPASSEASGRCRATMSSRAAESRFRSRSSPSHLPGGRVCAPQRVSDPRASVRVGGDRMAFEEHDPRALRVLLARVALHKQGHEVARGVHARATSTAATASQWLEAACFGC